MMTVMDERCKIIELCLILGINKNNIFFIMSIFPFYRRDQTSLDCCCFSLYF